MGAGAPRQDQPDQLQIAVAVPTDGHEDWPHVQLMVNGVELAELVGRPGYLGLDPTELLDAPSPFLSRPWRRVALYRCNCGELGCANLTPLIASRSDSTVAWTDFRSYTGVFESAVVDGEPRGGDPISTRDLVFASDAYEGEVRRACADRSWETLPRTTARLLAGALREHSDRLALAGFRLWGTWPSRTDADAVVIDLRRRDRDRDLVWQQTLVQVKATGTTAQLRADRMMEALQAVPADRWSTAFPWRR